MTSLLPENRVVILIDWLSKYSHNYEKILWDCRLIFSGSHQWHAWVEFKHFNNLNCKQQNCPCLQNWIELRMKTHRGESVGFSYRAALWFLQWFCLCKVSETNVMLSFDLPAIFTIKCSDSVSFSFLFPCFLFYLLRTK